MSAKTGRNPRNPSAPGVATGALGPAIQGQSMPAGGKGCVGRESNPGQLLGRQLCSPLYHQRHTLGVPRSPYMRPADARYLPVSPPQRREGTDASRPLSSNRPAAWRPNTGSTGRQTLRATRDKGSSDTGRTEVHLEWLGPARDLWGKWGFTVKEDDAEENRKEGLEAVSFPLLGGGVQGEF